jgi:predicted Zn finger-like uncharacterized protein
VYTRCPDCHTAFRVNVDQLRASQGEVQCERCQTVFNALPSLAMTAKGAVARGAAQAAGGETALAGHFAGLAEAGAPLGRLPDPEDVDLDADEEPDLPASKVAAAVAEDEEPEPTGSGFGQILFYAFGSLAFAGLLGFQIFAFKSQSLAQQAFLRPWLTRVCATLGCELPLFRDLDRIKIVDRALNAGEGARPSLEFSMIFENESSLPQAFPRLKLVLNDLHGQAVAERIFEPSEYLDDWREGATMPLGQRIEVRLRMVKPERDVSDFAVYPL